MGLAGFMRRAMPFYWPICSLQFCLLLFFLSLYSVFVSVLWGWDLRTDRVLINLYIPCTANIFLIIIIIIVCVSSDLT